MAKRKADSLESRLIEACLEERKAHRNWRRARGCAKQPAAHKWIATETAYYIAADALLAEREKGGKV